MVSDYSVLDTPGFVVELRHYRIERCDRQAIWRLVLELRCCCRSAVRGGMAGFDLADNTLWYLRLREVDPLAVNFAVLTAQRAHPGWRLPGDPHEPIHDRVEAYFAGRRL